MKSLVAGLAVALALVVAATASPALAITGPVPPTQSAIHFAHVADRTPMPAFLCVRRPSPALAASAHGDGSTASLAGGGALAAVLVGSLALLRRRHLRRAV